MGSWVYNFTTINPDGSNSTLEYSYTIEADDINAVYSYPAEGVIVNRSQLTNFTINIYDTDNASAPGYLLPLALGGDDYGKGKIYIYKAGQNETPDSGLDIDSLRAVALAIKNIVIKQHMGILVITHYQRILHYLKPDFVHVLIDGVIKKSDGIALVRKIERGGYAAV